MAYSRQWSFIFLQGISVKDLHLALLFVLGVFNYSISVYFA